MLVCAGDVLQEQLRWECFGVLLGLESLGTAPGVASEGPDVVPAENTVVHAAVTGSRVWMPRRVATFASQMFT